MKAYSVGRLSSLLTTLDKTLLHFKEDTMVLTAESYKGLGRGYAENPEFRAFYDKDKPGLADFFCAAMEYYADTELDK